MICILLGFRPSCASGHLDGMHLARRKSTLSSGSVILNKTRRFFTERLIGIVFRRLFEIKFVACALSDQDEPV
jgi:hypothetical protein